MTIDPFTTQVLKDAIVAVGEEMFHAMIRTSMSPIIYESTDFAVGLTDAQGELLAQGNGVTAFLATLDTAAQGALAEYGARGLHEGDVILTNSPYLGGGTHLSDVVVIVPIFWQGELIAFAVNKAHWTEIGGKDAGSVSSTATEIYQEGLHFRFIKLFEAGRVNDAVTRIIAANVRLPDATLGDMFAGVAAARTGERRLHELLGRYGAQALRHAMRDMLDDGDRLAQLAIAKLPDGEYTASDVVEEDGLGNGPFELRVCVRIAGKTITADFTGTSAQAPGPINSCRTGLITATRCALKALFSSEVPTNSGSFRPLQVVCPEGTLLTAREPAPVSIYYESLISTIELVWRALAPLVPQRLPAGHYRSVCATFISGTHPEHGGLFVSGEPLLGGWGASASHDGANGQFCCGNGETYNVPVEIAEERYGLRVDRYAFTDDACGAGEHRGGKGVDRVYIVTADDARLTVAYTRTASRPWGMAGGQSGTGNACVVHRRDGSKHALTMATAVPVARDEQIWLRTGSGGGYGDPKRRARERVRADLRDGYIDAREAREVYGLVE
jgi:N-methylhydantoinase B